MKELFQHVKIILILESIPHDVLNLLYPNDVNKGYKSYCCINNIMLLSPRKKSLTMLLISRLAPSEMDFHSWSGRLYFPRAISPKSSVRFVLQNGGYPACGEIWNNSIYMWLTRQKLTHISLWEQLCTKLDQGQLIHRERQWANQKGKQMHVAIWPMSKRLLFSLLFSN